MPIDFAASFRLGDFIVDSASGTLTLDDQVTQLQPKVMQLLGCLVEHHGQIVTKEYLLENVWKGTYVVDGALRRCVFLLRKALTIEEGGESPLETLPRRGYRLLLSPQALDPDEEESTLAVSDFEGDAYRGLQVFDQSHSDIFFGRNAAVQQVVDAMRAQNESGHGFCLILGPSGSGKSSLALAGVLPALLKHHQQTNDDAELVPLSYKLSESPTNPLGDFAARLLDVLVDGDAADERVKALARMLDSDEDAAVSTVLTLLENGGGQSKKLLLVFDQFEELLTPEVDEAFRSRLLAVLYPLVRSGQVWMIATMRSEFYPQFAAIESLRYLRGEHGQVDLAFPGAAEIADIVRRPARLAGLKFSKDDSNRRLDQIIIDDATQQTNSLPLLQFALSELELRSPDKVLRVEDYQSLGTLEGCLSRHADRTFDAVSDEARDALSTVMTRMVIADPRNANRVLKRTVPLNTFEPGSGARDLVNAFIDARLVSAFIDPATGEPVVQFAHEAVLENWERGRDWVQANYADIRFRGWLNELATRWDEDNRQKHYLLNDGKPLVEAKRLISNQSGLPEKTADFVKASNRRASIRDAIRGGVTVALAALSIIALLMWRSAEINSNRAIKASQRAQTVSDLLQSLFDDADPGRSGDPQLTAVELLDRAMDRMGIILASADAVDQAAILAELGETYLLMGDHDTAYKLFKRAETLLPQIDNEYPDVASRVLIELGGIYREQGKLDESDAYLERALVLATEAKDPLLTAHALNLQGLVARLRADHQAAATLFVRAQDALAGTATTQAVQLRPSLFANLGSALMQSGQLDDALKAFDQALSLREEHGLDQTADQTTVLSSLGSLRRLQGDNDEAVQFFAQAYELRSRLHGPNHPRNGAYLVNMATAQMGQRDYAAARGSAGKGLDVVAEGSGHQSSIVALLHANYAISSWLAGESLTPEELSAAASQVAVLASQYSENHNIVRGLRSALLGLEIDRAAGADTNELPRLCDALEAKRSVAPAAQADGSPLRVKIDDYLSPNGPCANR